MFDNRGMDEMLPLTALLSFALVAFTIESDNTAESLTPHTTTRLGKSTAAGGPWLTSMVMWMNCLRHLPDEGITVEELERRARTGTNLNGMMRWGYIFMAPSPMDQRAKPPERDWIVKATVAGRAASKTWETVPAAIERRWEKRFGWEEVEQLRAALRAVVAELPATLPDCMPILGFGLALTSGTRNRGKENEAAPAEAADELSLPALLARVLVGLAREFEEISPLGIALCMDVLRVMTEKGERVRDLPALTGVSKEAIAMALGFMEKRGLSLEDKGSTGKARVVKLTAKGRTAQLAYERLLSGIEAKWSERFGDKVARLRRAIEKLLGDSGQDQAELLEGCEAPKGCWRAMVPKPKTLPWYPMVLHRGGFPDGS